jgi:hypothetical protein
MFSDGHLHLHNFDNPAFGKSANAWNRLRNEEQRWPDIVLTERMIGVTMQPPQKGDGPVRPILHGMSGLGVTLVRSRRPSVADRKK